MEDGTIKLKNGKYVRILKVVPINFNLKSDLEKESILNSYKIFLKTCNFDIQILIQSNKENLSKHISNIQKNSEKKLLKISNDYIQYINKINIEKKSASKNYFIIIKNSENISEKNNLKNKEEIIIEELNEKYFKIKECLSRCGNIVINYSEKKEILKIIFSFFNSKIFLNKGSDFYNK